MRQLSHPFALSACSLAATLLVSACGGGGASPPPGTPGSSGFAVDGYLSGSTVLCDSNGNGASDAGEATTSTDSSGFFKFTAPCTATVVITGGTSIDTQLPFTGKLKAPAGSTIVTPLTTLLAEGMTIDQVNTALGLPAGTDLLNIDPARKIDDKYVNPDLFRKTLAVQQLVQKTSEMLAGLASSGGSAALPAIYSEVAGSVAAMLRTAPVLVSGNTINQAGIAALVAGAVQKVAASTTLSAEVKSGASALNPSSVGEVIAGSLKAQAEAILSATDANVVNTTKTAQMDTQVTTFVQTNKTALVDAPSGSTASLATTLTTAVTSTITGGGGGTTAPPPPATAGTVLLNFDDLLPISAAGGEGGEGSGVFASPPAGGGTGSAYRVLRSGGQPYALAILEAPLPLTTTRKSISARVYSPMAGIPMVVKLEGATSSINTGDVQANETVLQGWQTLTWTFPTAGTATYSKMVLLPNLGTVDAAPGKAYFFDEIALAPAAAAGPASCVTSTSQCISFSESTIAMLSFEGLVSATVVDDPVAGASNKVAKLVKGPSGELWAGATVYTAGTVNSTPGERSVLTIDTVGLNTSKIVTLRSYTSAAIGTKMTLKLENGVDAGQNIAAETVTTKQNEWETLIFDFANTSTGVFSSTTTYNTASIFPAFSIPGPNAGPLSANTNFYFDELKYAVAAAATPTPTPTPTPTATTLVTFDETTPPAFAGFDGGEGSSITAAGVPAGGSGKALKILRTGGQVWAGAKLTGLSIPLSTTTTTITARVHSAVAGVPFVLKLEGPGASAEVQPTTAVVAGWQTLTWVFTGGDLKTWSDIVFLPNLGTLASASPGETYYIDDVKVAGSATASPAPTPTPTATTLVTFDETTPPAFAGFDGGEGSSITATGVPDGGSAKALKILRTGGQVWAGAKVTGLSIPLSTTTTTITARVHSAAAGVPFVMKLEGPGASAEVQPTTAVVAGWQTLTWVFAGGDLKTWSDIVFLPNLGTLASASPGETYYVDDIKLVGTGGGSAATPSSLVYASNYSETPTPWKSVEGGDAGRYLDESVGGQDWWSGVATADTTPSFYFGYGFNIGAKPWGFGAFVKAPGNGTASVSPYSKVKIAVWGNDQLVNTRPNFAVILKNPAIGGCVPTVKGNIAVVAAGVQTYTLPLSGFTLQDACGLTTATQALATGVTEVHVQVLGTNVQFTAGGDAGGFYPNGLNIGPISFIN